MKNLTTLDLDLKPRPKLFKWLIAVGIGVLLFLALSWLLIDWDPTGCDVYPGGAVLRDDAGNVLRVSLGEGDVDCRPYYRASRDDWIVKALVAAEDRSYWTHCGVRPLSILRAAAQNVFYRRRISGASTITMQAVRLMRPHPKTLWWKWKEAVKALKLERKHDKLWILSQYLNRAPYGSNLVGIEAAAQGWFGKGAKDLGIGEAAMLAGMVQAPTRFRPDRGYSAALKRRDYVLGRMLELGEISSDQYAAARSVRPEVCRSPRPFLAPHFCDHVMSKLKAGGGDYVTTLNADLQRQAESAVARAAAEGGYSVAVVIMRVDSAAVKALACSGDYFDPKGGQVNTADCPRPAGSTLKPLLTALAMDRGFVTPETRHADVPKSYKGYRPANFDASYRGLVTTRDALVLSLNLPFVQMLNQVGVSEFGSCLRELGFAHLGGTDDTFGLGMAIGNVEVTLLELVAAYATVARGGKHALSEASCYLIYDMLSGDERSSAAFGHVADVRMSRFAWKTGTSSAYRDAWTVAWNPEYVVGVWCGHLSGGFGDKSLVGAKAAAPVAMGLARSLYPQNNGPWFAEPPGIARRDICSLSGLPAGPCCPQRESGRYLPGHSSNRPCEVHVLGPDGKVVERRPDRPKLQIVRPQDGEQFHLVPGMGQQKVVCQVRGNPEGSKLWWLLDGAVAGTTTGSEPFAVEMTPGQHVVSCSTASGDTANVAYSVVAATVMNDGVRP